MLKIYVDTNVYMDFFGGGDRESRLMPLSDFAAHLFRQIQEKKYQLVISDWVYEEFCKYRNMKEIETLVADLGDVISITKTPEDVRKAKALSNTNFPDAFHVVLALRGQAVHLVTRDKHFAEFQHIIDVVTPEYL